MAGRRAEVGLAEKRCGGGLGLGGGGWGHDLFIGKSRYRRGGGHGLQNERWRSGLDDENWRGWETESESEISWRAVHTHDRSWCRLRARVGWGFGGARCEKRRSEMEEEFADGFWRGFRGVGVCGIAVGRWR